MHIRCDVGVGVQREAGVGMPQNPRQGFGIHAAGDGVGGEGVAQIMEADVRQSRFVQNRFHVRVGAVRR